MSTLSGLGKSDRECLTAVLRRTQHTISVSEAAKILGLSKQRASKLLARWAMKGWLSRIKQGIYIPVPLESASPNIALEDPWVIATKLYFPCYIGGWSAAEYWGLTEQIFRTVVIFTSKKIKDHSPVIQGTRFLMNTVSEKAMFGLKVLWHGSLKISVSDPSRTILDFMVNPKLGGGIRPVIDMLKNYLESEHKNMVLLIQYAKQLNNGAVFKRLGFLLEQVAPEEADVIKVCKESLTMGRVKLDPSMSPEKLITRWRLWVRKNWSSQ